jgi:hypothetical protein
LNGLNYWNQILQSDAVLPERRAMAPEFIHAK